MATQRAAPDTSLPAAFTDAQYALPGSLARRYMRCGKQNCRCKAAPPVLHGPYLHWTRTIAGKTETQTLTEEQAQRYQPWFDNARRLRELLTELEDRSLRAFHDAED
jgi:hypothetical protein